MSEQTSADLAGLEELQQKLARCLVANQEGAICQEGVEAFLDLYDQAGGSARQSWPRAVHAHPPHCLFIFTETLLTPSAKAGLAACVRSEDLRVA
jgi:hypothetical protein